MIQGMFENGALPALERMVEFTEHRHGVLTDNIANLSNPFFKPYDLDPVSFQAALREAIDERRDSVRPHAGPLRLRDTDQLRFHRDGMTVRPRQLNETILFHDRSNVDLERQMQRLAENTLAHRVAIEMVRSEFAILEMAIRERP